MKTHPLDDDSSLMQRFLDSPGAGWLALRIIVVIGPLAVATAILLFVD